MGRSGVGKSTLLGAFLQRGYAMLADDKAAIVVDGDVPLALPGYPLIRLAEDAVNELQFPVNGSRLKTQPGQVRCCRWRNSSRSRRRCAPPIR